MVGAKRPEYGRKLPPVFNKEVVLWKVKVGSAYLGFEDEPVVSCCRGFIVVCDAVMG